MSGLIYEKNISVKSYECDAMGDISISALLNIMLYVSEEQNYKLGVGNVFLLAKDLSWIVLQNILTIERLPKANEVLTITSQVISFNKRFAYREFKAFGKDGELCVKVHCTCALIDCNKRKMIQLVDELVAPLQVNRSEKLIRTPNPEKINAQSKITTDYAVRYLDIDENQHVNNSKYLEWMIDSIGLEFIKSHKLKSINIKYKREIVYGNQVKSLLSFKKSGHKSIVSAHKIENKEECSCEASMIWQSN